MTTTNDAAERLPCTFPNCGKPESDSIHPKGIEQMGGGRHVYRHDKPDKHAYQSRAALLAQYDRDRQLANDYGVTVKQGESPVEAMGQALDAEREALAAERRATVDDPAFFRAVEAVFNRPGEWGPAQGYYRENIRHFLDLLRHEYAAILDAEAER